MRWAQGWFQVSLRHFLPGLRSPELSVRNKLGLLHLLFWREIYPWISIQIIPVVVFWAARGQIDWFVPLFIVTSILTFLVGPGQAMLAFSRATPQIRAHRSWFVAFVLFAPVYSELKNVIVRVAQVKEIIGERDWRVTPRSAKSTAPDDKTSVAA